MKNHGSYRRNKSSVALVIAVVLVMMPSISLAATNTGTGDIDGTALTNGTFDLSSAQLALFKRAFLASTGTALGDGDTLPVGTQVKFMIYLNNNTDAAALDVSVQDILDNTTFLYDDLVDSIKVGTIASSTCTGGGGTCLPAEELTIFNAVDGLPTALTSGPDGDAVSYTLATTTIDAGDGAEAGNGQVDIAADTVWAMVFTVTMQ